MTKTVSDTVTKPESIPPYFYDGSLLLAEKVGNQIKKIYINDGQGIVGMVRPIYDGSNQLTHYQRLYYLYDSLGSVSAVTGEHGLPLQNYTYSPFGTCLNVQNDPINSLQFVGRYGGYLDSDTGLTYFWHRWYDSKDGRWISRDPIGIKGGINLYGYANNTPNNQVDYKDLVSQVVCGKNGTFKIELDSSQAWTPSEMECIQAHEQQHFNDLTQFAPNACKNKCEGDSPDIPNYEFGRKCECRAYQVYLSCMMNKFMNANEADGLIINSRIKDIKNKANQNLGCGF